MNRTAFLLTRRTLLGAASSVGILTNQSLAGHALTGADADPLLAGFNAPPKSTAPWVYWYWISENVSREGITQDLEAMARVGIGEAVIGIIKADAAPGDFRTLSEPWWDLVVHAVAEGHRTGVDIGFFNSPGWSQSGGPWVKPSQAMRYVASSELRVAGPQKLANVPVAPHPDFQDISLIAFPVPRGEGSDIADHGARIRAMPALKNPERLLGRGPTSGCAFDSSLVGKLSSPSAGATVAPGERPPQIIDIITDAPFMARSLELRSIELPIKTFVDLQAADDRGHFQTIRTFVLDRSNPKTQVGPMPFAPVTISFPAVAARRFRLIFRHIGGVKGAGLSRIKLSGAARVDSYIEKQLGKMHQTSKPVWNSYLWPSPTEPESPAFAVDLDKIVDISNEMGPDGAIGWDVPAGEWIILRSGMVPTGEKNHPAPPDATGLEVDKMNTVALRHHFDAYVGDLLRRLPQGKERAAFKHVVADSYETGSQNWTDGFHELFAARYGYDPRPWLPVLSGRIVGSADRSERFLWDLRRLVADLISENYVGALRALSRRQGVGMWLENYGHWGFPGEFLQYGGKADRLGGEFWVGKENETEIRAATSASEIYGKPIISAEAFTDRAVWRNHPGSLRRLGDWAFSRGINHFVLHVYIAQPSDDRRPGVNAWFGTEFNRHNTWFEQSKAWIDCLRRSSFLLQQGRRVAEIAYYVGEDAPKMTGLADPPPPAGFEYNFINADVIETRLTVRDGRFLLPDGNGFAVLVLPPSKTMRPAVARKLRALVAAGGRVVGEPPTVSPSLQDYGQADQEVETIARDIWQASDGSGAGHVKFENGQIFGREGLENALAEGRARPSVVDEEGLLWTHRRLTDGDLFFLSNQREAPIDVSPSFAAPHGTPQLWDAVTGHIATVVTFKRTDKRVSVVLRLPAAASIFLLFRKNTSPVTAAVIENSAATSIVPLVPFGRTRLGVGTGPARALSARSVAGPWQVVFPTLVTAHRTFEKPTSWTDNSDPAVRHFSGTAVYRTDLMVLKSETGRGKRLALDLGDVGMIAEVLANGRDCGTLWCAPFTADVTEAVRAGRNRLEIRITNTWFNRLAGRQRFEPDVPGMSDQPWLAVTPNLSLYALQPSGLLGPVTLRSYLVS